jgi:hypothetical protein
MGLCTSERQEFFLIEKLPDIILPCSEGWIEKSLDQVHLLWLSLKSFRNDHKIKKMKIKPFFITFKIPNGPAD